MRSGADYRILHLLLSVFRKEGSVETWTGHSNPTVAIERVQSLVTVLSPELGRAVYLLTRLVPRPKIEAESIMIIKAEACEIEYCHSGFSSIMGLSVFNSESAESRTCEILLRLLITAQNQSEPIMYGIYKTQMNAANEIATTLTKRRSES